MTDMSERIIGTCETKSDTATKPGRLILVERDTAGYEGRLEFVVWWEETLHDKTPIIGGRSCGFYTDDRTAAQHEFANRISREANYWSTSGQSDEDRDENGGAA